MVTRIHTREILFFFLLEIELFIIWIKQRFKFQVNRKHVTHRGKKMKLRKIIKNDIYLFNTESYDEEFQSKLNKLFDKIKEATFNVKLIKNTTILNYLSRKKNIEKKIAHSCVFLAIVKNYTFNLENFKKEILFAYESSIKIVLILLEVIEVINLNDNLKNVYENSDIYSFYKDQKAANNIIPIEFNSFLFGLNQNIRIQVSL